MNTIFVQLASYRDPELLPTIDDMLDKAALPQNLRIGICRQYEENDRFDNIDKYRSDSRFRIIDVPYLKSKGACRARNKIQALYDNEAYTLQIDSHMRFQENWDSELIKIINDLQKSGIEKPLITGYVPSYDPENDPNGRVRVPWRMTFDRFIPEGAVFFIPEVIPGWELLDATISARFYSAHFCFTLGEFSTEVQHNPKYYFHGEEISITVRAYTHGYDLFHLHKVLIWHEYTRKGRTKQWDDDKDWVSKNTTSHLTNRRLFGMDGLKQSGHRGKYGFGNKRSLKDYEEYAGIRFVNRSVQEYTLSKSNPPNPPISSFESVLEWENSFLEIFKHCIDVYIGQLPESDYDFWAVAFHGSDDSTMYRQDADEAEINNLLKNADTHCKIWRAFRTSSLPAYWVVWPHSKSKGWCERIEGRII